MLHDIKMKSRKEHELRLQREQDFLRASLRESKSPILAENTNNKILSNRK